MMKNAGAIAHLVVDVELILQHLVAFFVNFVRPLAVVLFTSIDGTELAVPNTSKWKQSH
jgi:hypothetical protein